MVLGSAATFGTMPILAKFAYAAGLTPLQTLAYRFLIAAGLLFALAVGTGKNPLRVGPKALPLFLVGVVLYAGMAGSFFGALTVLPASLTELIAYLYPSLVALGAWLFFGQRVGPRLALALVVSFSGLALLVGGAQVRGGFTLLLAFASPVFYASYILASERLMPGIPAIATSALVHAGAALTFTLALLALGPRALPASGLAWSVISVIAILPSMLGISLLLAGIARTGGTRAALLSTFEPVVTIVLAAVLLSDRLGPLQLAGGGMVLAAVLLMQWRRRDPIPPLQP
ncbi:MAG: DMT family transporter [Actinomycetota bacterium]|nr:DMT family transporter [Actinomycetota bacterium]